MKSITFQPFRRYDPLWNTNPRATILIPASKQKIPMKYGSVCSLWREHKRRRQHWPPLERLTKYVSNIYIRDQTWVHNGNSLKVYNDYCSNLSVYHFVYIYNFSQMLSALPLSNPFPLRTSSTCPALSFPWEITSSTLSPDSVIWNPHPLIFYNLQIRIQLSISKSISLFLTSNAQILTPPQLLT